AAALSTLGSSATLTWQPPALNTDGTPLTDLSAFKVYWGTTQGTYPYSAQISNVAARTHTVTGLQTGQWYFVVTALNSKGVESPKSNVWTKTVP
ncbi:MAG TPA: fibronectin type III domain-containing protein, partial [Gammaproteobacteria bacterium]|nr:fibronectin type III domain-containing protein [Gammaproteobacteria bacterium]